MSETIEYVKKARESAKTRKFEQTFDLAIGLRGLDMKKPESKIKTQASLPHGLGKPVKIGVFADALIPQAKAMGESIILIRKDEIEPLGKDKRSAKKMARRCRMFFAEAPLMPLVGKFLGPVLAVRNKMPKPIPPTLPNLKGLIEKNNNLVDVVIKNTPVIHCPVGAEKMEDQKIADNVNAVLNVVKTALPNGKDNIRNCYLKLTMGKPVKVVI